MAHPSLLIKKKDESDPLKLYILKHSSKTIPAQDALTKATLGLPDFFMITDPDQLYFLQNICRLIGAKKTLDVGVYTGYSALSIALTLPPGGKVVACDISEDCPNVGKPFWKQAGVEDKIDLRIAPASETLQKLIENGEEGTFDFAFIDADKTGYPDYYEKCLRLIRSGGVLALDNMLYGCRVLDEANQEPETNTIRKLNDFVFNDDRVNSNLMQLGDGTLLVFKK